MDSLEFLLKFWWKFCAEKRTNIVLDTRITIALAVKYVFKSFKSIFFKSLIRESLTLLVYSSKSHKLEAITSSCLLRDAFLLPLLRFYLLIVPLRKLTLIPCDILSWPFFLSLRPRWKEVPSLSSNILCCINHSWCHCKFLGQRINLWYYNFHKEK